MPKIQKLLESLADITSYRDVQRLEFTLLKTLDEILQPISLQLLKLDEENQLVQSLKYCSKFDEIEELESDKQTPLQLSLVYKALIHGQAAMRQLGDVYLFAFPVASLNNINLCLLINSNTPLLSPDKRLITSFFRIYHNFCHLLKDAQTDELTGLLNRKTFDENFQRISGELLTGEETLEPEDRRHLVGQKAENYWMAVLDVDHFKKVNDNFGHIYGDEVLILLSRLMQKLFRSEDLLYRFGGEEFVIIARCGELNNALTVFERLRQVVADHEFPQIGQVTVSLGVVQVSPGILATTLLDQADQALYYAKTHGRNRVCFHRTLVEQGEIQVLAPKTGSVDLF